jgi:hypothetical protein
LALGASVVVRDPLTAGFGPYNDTFLAGGIGESGPLAPQSPVVAANGSWSMTGWIRPTLQQAGDVVVAAIGNAGQDTCRCLVLRNGRLVLLSGATAVPADRLLQIAKWQAMAVTFDGTTARLYLDGSLVGSRAMSTPPAPPVLNLAPVETDSDGVKVRHFGGSLAHFEIEAAALSEDAVRQLAANRPRFDLVVFHEVGVGWPWQEHAWRGLFQPQDPWTLPKSKTPPSAPVATPTSPATAALTAAPGRDQTWTIGSWRLAEAPTVSATGIQLSQPGFDDSGWYPAAVPGTVLTTLVARGVYPEPTYGLNNLAIPESLAHQDYWYRSRFEVPPGDLHGKRFTLTFNGVNYSAQVWLNGKRLGSIKGAFTRGTFDVTELLRGGSQSGNVLAVRVSPPPHPGIAHEESIAAGPGANGGNLALDGPTFIAAEGWDWIPGIRDRNTGLWQDVELHATGAVTLRDPHVITRLPLPRTDQADVSIAVEAENHLADATPATLEARFEGVTVRKSLTLPPGISHIELAPAEFPQLHLRSPRLWWPNGYGSPELYSLSLSVAGNTQPSDTLSLHFGIRQLTYELSLFDHDGRLRRVEVDPTEGSARGERLVDTRHEAIKQTPNGWAESLTLAAENSPAVRPVASESLAPYLVIRVNGVPIAVRGGSWGTDEALKRISRERLEPYFRLHKEANLNIIRNWLGQNTEEVFYDLADQYGLLVLNDFWASTQEWQVEPQDPELFLANAREVLLRYRNHPSIAVWFGRNEGVPQPIINEGLGELIADLDGTRHYTGSSNTINLQGSGPYNYRPPYEYFTELAQGFSVEVGTPSVATIEALEASIPEADRWPMSDTLAYHDWHFGGNGNVATFMSTLERQFGTATSLADFERKAQMMDYVSYRAIFEGFQAHLWTQNSGRLLWMTHPSWPSNTWQIYSSDYDTQASCYGVKLACEPVHAQMNLPDYRLAIVNTTRQDRRGLKLTSRVLSLDGRLLSKRTESVNARSNATDTLAPLDLGPLLEREDVVLVVLTLDESSGARVSENIYWQGREDRSLRKLGSLAPQAISITTHTTRRDNETVIGVELLNKGTSPALAAKLTAVDTAGKRVLPVFYSDNYLTLLPKEPRKVEIRCAAGTAQCSQIQLRGWNVEPATVPVQGYN